jgi:hypothetical protein
MSEKSWQDDVGRQVRTLQIIVAAIVSGVLMFLFIACLVAGAPREGRSVLSTIALAVAAILVVLRLIVPAVIASRSRRKILRGQYSPGLGVASPAVAEAKRQHLETFFRRTGDAGRLMIVYMTNTIMAAAILEGAAFLLLVAYLVDHQAVTLAVAIALLVAIAAHMPWRARVFAWIEEQLRWLEEQRQFGPRRD